MFPIIFVLVAYVSTFSGGLHTKPFQASGRTEAKANTNNSTGDPLILTKLIEQNCLQEARNKSRVHHSDFLGVKSYSGFFTVNKDYGSNLFFWFFPAEIDYDNAPVLVWLQGGPGASSLFGLFAENGPFVFTGEDKLTLRNHTWSKEQSVIFIDNPAGTGYSFTSAGGYCKNQTQIGEGLYEALRQFFLVFPELQKNDFFVTGESYAGKYVPALAYTIHIKNPAADVKIKLKGLAIGNGYSDPINMNHYSDYLYELGLIDLSQKAVMKANEQMMRSYIAAELWLEATDIFYRLRYLYTQYTGCSNDFNYLTVTDPTDIDTEYFTKYIQKDDVRAALHVGDVTYHPGDDEVVQAALKEDIAKSVAPLISQLLDSYSVLIYSGQLDVVVAYPLTVNYLRNLNFSGAELYGKAERHRWYVGTELAGYVKEAGNLTEVLVRNAGHMVPYDQPKWAYDLIYNFIRRKKLYS